MKQREVVDLRIKAGVVGLGFIGAAHVEAIRRLGYVDVVAVCDISKEQADLVQGSIYYSNYEDILNDPSIDVIHNCTPNHMHYEINKMAIENGKHIFSEKPLTMNTYESRMLLDALERTPVYNAVNFNYRAYENVRRMREYVTEGIIGEPYIVHGSYLQDWLLFETDNNWRVDTKFGGTTRALSDIGSHWCDLAQYVMNAKITEVFADIQTKVPIRGGQTVTTEDYAAVLLRFENGTSGVFRVSQVSAGRKNFLEIEINGSMQSLHWNQEECDKLWMGFRDRDNTLGIRNSVAHNKGIRHSSLPPGHAEGWSDGLRNNITSFYHDIGNEKVIGGYATFCDGHEIMLVVEAILDSVHSGSWKKVRYELRS